MSGTWDPFQPAAPLTWQREQQAAAQTDLARLARATFSTPAGQAFLAALAAEQAAQPSYLPGMSFDQVAWSEGQKALLRRIQTLLDQPET